jgi:hypothetical protein
MGDPAGRAGALGSGRADRAVAPLTPPYPGPFAALAPAWPKHFTAKLACLRATTHRQAKTAKARSDRNSHAKIAKNAKTSQDLPLYWMGSARMFPIRPERFSRNPVQVLASFACFA